MASQSSQLFRLLDYPRGDEERGRELYSRLTSLGLGELTFISKGYRGVVFKAYLNGRPVAVKVKRPDTLKDVPLKEFKFLSHLYNIYGSGSPAPIPYAAEPDFIVMEWVEGRPFPEAFKELKGEAVKEALKACYKLDKAGVEHSEIKGEKHLIHTSSSVKVIDFESAKFKERPRNLLQFVGYHLIGRGLYRELGLSRAELLKLLEDYKKSPQDAFNRLLALIG